MYIQIYTNIYKYIHIQAYVIILYIVNELYTCMHVFKFIMYNSNTYEPICTCRLHHHAYNISFKSSTYSR